MVALEFHPLNGLRVDRFLFCLPLEWGLWFAICFILVKCMVFIILARLAYLALDEEEFFKEQSAIHYGLILPNLLGLIIICILLIALNCICVVFLLVGILLRKNVFFWPWLLLVILETLAGMLFIYLGPFAVATFPESFIQVLMKILLFILSLIQGYFWLIVYSYLTKLLLDDYYI